MSTMIVMSHQKAASLIKNWRLSNSTKINSLCRRGPKPMDNHSAANCQRGLCWTRRPWPTQHLSLQQRVARLPISPEKAVWLHLTAELLVWISSIWVAGASRIVLALAAGPNFSHSPTWAIFSTGRCSKCTPSATKKQRLSLPHPGLIQAQR